MYVITGATGNTGSRIARTLLDQGKQVRVLARGANGLRPLTERGAEPCLCDLTDSAALTRAFEGAEAVYAIIPPTLSSPDYLNDQRRVIDACVNALGTARVPYLVLLSSIGADKPSGTGPIVGLHEFEERLKRIAGLNSLALRPAYFMENTLAQAQIIPQMGACAGPVRADVKVPMIATRDIADAAADELLRLDFRGHSTRELLGPRDHTYNDVAATIGRAIERPDLKYVQAPDDQLRPALMQLGMSGNVADLILELSRAINTGHIRALEPRAPRNTTPTTLETFVAEEFVPIYRAQSSAA